MCIPNDKRPVHMKEAIIIFTRVPIPHKTKTRLMPVYTPEECAAIHSCFLRDIYSECKKTGKALFIFYTPKDSKDLLTKLLGTYEHMIAQEGCDLGERMLGAIRFVLERGFSSCILIGSDVPEITAETVYSAFSALQTIDVVISPVNDGGYCLIGMKQVIPEAFGVREYGTSSVCEDTVRYLNEKKYSVRLLPVLYDIDTPQDIACFIRRIRTEPSLVCKHSIGYFSKHKKISVIVPVYNEESNMHSIQTELKKMKGCEVIFVDGGSTDNTLALVEKQYTVVHSAKGRALQMNKGALESSGSVLFFLHADSILPDNAVEQIHAATEHCNFGCFHISFTSHAFFFTICAFMSNMRAILFKIPFGDQGLFIERTVFFESGMFPEIPIMEDYQFSLNMKKTKEKLCIIKAHIITSARRYKGSFFHKLKTAIHMFYLRSLYRRGKNIKEIARMYKDIR